MNSIGYILEVDLEYPDQLHYLHNDYPLASNVQLIVIRCQIIIEKLLTNIEIKVSDVKKLVPNLGNKTNYVAHQRNLQLYLSLGM